MQPPSVVRYTLTVVMEHSLGLVSLEILACPECHLGDVPHVKHGCLGF